MRFDRLQRSPQVMQRLRSRAAGGLPIQRHGGRERGNAFEDRAAAAQGLAEKEDGDVGEMSTGLELLDPALVQE